MRIQAFYPIPLKHHHHRIPGIHPEATVGLVLRSHQTFVELVVTTFSHLKELVRRTFPFAVAGMDHPLTWVIKAVRCRKIKAATVAIATELVIIRTHLQIVTAVHLAYLILVKHLERSSVRQVQFTQS